MASMASMASVASMAAVAQIQVKALAIRALSQLQQRDVMGSLKQLSRTQLGHSEKSCYKIVRFKRVLLQKFLNKFKCS